MRCMVIEQFNAPLVPMERDIPVLCDKEVLVKVGACGVCRTDLKIWQGKSPIPANLPLVPGHEIAGEIVDVARGMDAGRIGEHIVISPYMFCGTCEFCRKGRHNLCSRLRGVVGLTENGGYAEYVKTRVDCVLPVSRDVPFHLAAIIPDAIATSYHALVKKARVQEGERIAIFGIGGLGIHAVQIGVGLGAHVLAVDIKAGALRLAEEMGAELTIRAGEEESAEKIMAISDKGVDAVIDFTGNRETEEVALRVLKGAGRFVAVGYGPGSCFSVNPLLLVAKELEIYGSRACDLEDVRRTIEWVSAGRLKPFVSATHPLTEANAVLEDLEKGETLGRSVLVP